MKARLIVAGTLSCLLILVTGLGLRSAAQGLSAPPLERESSDVAQANETTAGSLSSATAVVVSGTTAYVGFGTELHVVDVLTPSRPTALSAITLTEHTIRGLGVLGDLLYAGSDEDGMYVVSVTVPTGPIEVGHTTELTPVSSIVAEGDYVYTGGGVLGIFSRTDPSNPDLVSSVPGSNRNVEVQDTYAYQTYQTGSALRIYSVVNPVSPALVGSVSTSMPYDVDVMGNYAYLADYWAGFKVIAVTDPMSPTVIGSASTSGYANRVAVDGTHAYVCSQYQGFDGTGYLQDFNVADPAAPMEVAERNLPGGCNDLVVSDSHIYLVGSTGLLILSKSGLGEVGRYPMPVGFVDCSSVSEIPQSQCQALVALYNATGGDSWSTNIAWLETNKPCSWYGVECSAGNVVGLRLIQNQLTGEMPPEIGDLTALTELWLALNQLSGTIPSEIGNLTDLTELSLVNNQLSGVIPPSIGDLSSLQMLALSKNSLSGEIPPEFGNLTALVGVWLDNNQLSGELPLSLTNLSELYRFHFQETDLCEPSDADFQTWLLSIVDLTSTGVLCSPLDPKALMYDGPMFLPSPSVLVDEVDGKITVGDHVHLRLPIRNATGLAVVDGVVELQGSPGVSIYDGSNWGNAQSITIGDIPAGGVGYLDFWIFVTNPDPEVRSSLGDQALLQVRTGSGQWTLGIAISPISFDVSGGDDIDKLKLGSCLHSPFDFGIQRYAQFAAGATSLRTPPSNERDPDTIEIAVRNIAARVHTEFQGKEGVWQARVPDTTLLRTRFGYIGICINYADLTTGLIRALGIPARIVRALFYRLDSSTYSAFPGHAWTEAYLPDSGWRQVDSTTGAVLREDYYESEAGYRVIAAWADRYPLSSAGDNVSRLCSIDCYLEPIYCAGCLADRSLTSDRSCVENVTSSYHSMLALGALAATDAVDTISLDIGASTLVTRTVPFSLTADVVNRSLETLDVVTVSVSLYEDILSSSPLYSADQLYQTLVDLGPGESATLSWSLTPLVTGSALPLGVGATSGDSFAFAQRIVVVNEPDTPPPLAAGSLCVPRTVFAGEPVTLSTYVLDEFLQPVTDSLTTVTATVYTTEDEIYSVSSDFAYSGDRQAYQSVVTIPADAPRGVYHVGSQVSRPDYDTNQSLSSFFVVSELNLNVELSQEIIDPPDAVVAVAQVLDRGAVVTDAMVAGKITTPSGNVFAPFSYAPPGEFVLAFRPIDLAKDLGGAPSPGRWSIEVVADYLGSIAAIETTIMVRSQVYLPCVLR